jgi:hypothetical protein
MAAVRAFARLHVLMAKGLKPLEIFQQANKFVKSKLPALSEKLAVNPIYARVPRQPIHPRAVLRQTRRWMSTTAVRNVLREFGTEAGVGIRRTPPNSQIARKIVQSSGRAPFAHTLRPNLTGGALPRTAGGYGLGSGRIGGARYFSNGPAAPAQVVHNVSQAMRAFLVGGGKAQYDGVDPRSGEKRFRAVSDVHDRATKKIKSVPKATPGSYIDFNVNPTITALTPLGSVPGFKKGKMDTLNSEGLIDVLSVDFARSLKELLAILEDIKSLSSLGDLPISYEKSGLRVHFPGCDAQTVETLMEEFGLRRGTIGQDVEFDAFAGTDIALMFPFAPSKSGSEFSFYAKPLELRKDYRFEPEAPPSPILGNLETPDFSSASDDGFELFDDLRMEDINPYLSSLQEQADLPSTVDLHEDGNPYLSSPSGYETLRSSEVFDSGHPRADHGMPLEYQSFDGIYRFIELCDNARR